ncbi:MAG: adenosylcobalamin-dependent ribonucleoside-diphosphate reductase [Bacteroidales bacterium]|jgi:ribonucleoside-diphosphate reductase alpha chain|nr:adenosylcobalamin-dependent ribonucleoside-diphosphate reductase [Bacteroidales bacterium]
MHTDTMVSKKSQQTEHPQERTYTFDEAYRKSLEYFNGDELAAKVWVNKYAIKDSFGNIYEQSPDDMHWRLAREVARVERRYQNPMSEQELYDLFKNFRYIVPQGSPMTGIGNKFQIASLSNCFVIGNDSHADSYGGIMKIDQEQAQLMKRRGGVGHDLSHIRPKGSPVLNSALTSTGVVTFMERYSNTTLEVAQDGRRGALMLSISSKHPDTESFIDAKMTPGKITGANVSVKIDDDFMNAVINQRPYLTKYPIDSNTPTFTKEIDAQSLWNKIIHNAWKSAEPGILFWDTIIRESVPDCYAAFGYRTTSTNPCGEIPLCPYDSCRLLAINLFGYVENPFTPQAKFDFDLFRKHVRYAQRIMDDIIDLELEKIDAILSKIHSDPEDPEVKRVERRLWEQIRIKTEEGRRTGIGITAEGDMLAALGIRYGSDDGIDFSVEVQKSLALEAYRGSVELAKERGAFSIFDFSLEQNNPFIERIRKEDEGLYRDMQKYGRRNIALLTIAPTGTTSLMTQTTSGIEPAFALYYKRRRTVNPNDQDVTITFTDDKGIAYEEYMVFHHKFLDWLKANGYNVKEVMKYNDEQMKEIIEKSPYYKATSADVDWLNKVRMQGEIQKWVDHSISVTINLPENVSEEMVAKLYITAWQSGCKGITVYREGSREGILVSTKKDAPAKTSGSEAPRRRPASLDAEIIRFKNNKEDWIAFIGLYEGRPYEVFTGITDDEVFLIPKTITNGKIIKVKEEDGSKRYDFQYEDRYGYTNTVGGLSRMFAPEYWNYAKLISSVLRFGMPIPDVVNLVSSLHLNSETINTWKNGVERALKKYIPDGTKVTKGNKCPDCGEEGTLIYKEGCLTCQGCGYSKCG